MKTCAQCGSEFQHTHHRQIFCSPTCRKTYQALYYKQRNKDYKTYKRVYKPGTVSCLKCDAKFRSWDKTLNRICPRCSFHADDIRNGVSANFLERATQFA